METLPAFTPPPPPPPPPPKNSRTKLWIGLALGLVIVGVCCCVAGILTYLNWEKISNFFYTQTAISYSNSDAGISLYYPQKWVYEESSYYYNAFEVIFASSEAVLTSDTGIPATGAELIIVTNWMTTSDLDFTVNARSMDQVVEYFTEDIFVSSVQPQDLHNFTLSGYPAASGIYMGTIDTGEAADPSAVYVVSVLREQEILLIVGVCPQDEWSVYHATFDSILNSMSMITP